MSHVALILMVLLAALAASGSMEQRDFSDPQCRGRQVMVHLFEWSWDAVAEECETHLGPKGFCAVQVSPPNEHIQAKQWWARYQPVSYQLVSRSGNRQQFENMVARCNAAGVNVVVDLVINHMSGMTSSGYGTAGSEFDGQRQDYSGVPYSAWDFHQPACEVNNYQDAHNVRNCYLVGLNDLDGSKDYVRTRIADYINDLIQIGVKGFRIDAAKHMWPADLEAIQSKLHGSPFVFHEVINTGQEAIHAGEYFHLGKVTEFRACSKLASCLRAQDLQCLQHFGQDMMSGVSAVVFVDNHDNQRHHGGAGDVLTYRDDQLYKMAVGFLLAQSYGFKRIMSSFDFTDPDQGPPDNQSPCSQGWVCEHRWSSIANMVQFSNAVQGLSIDNWQVKEDSLGFSRGRMGFFAMGQLDGVRFFTGLPDGTYCDLIHDCELTIQVVDNGWAYFTKAQAQDPVVAILATHKL